MTELVCVTGTVIELKADATWGWGTSTVSSPSFGNTKDVSITGTGIKLTVDTTKPVILQLDITTAMLSVTDAYHAATGGVWANVSPLSVGLDGTVAVVTITSGLTPSEILRHNTDGVILENLTGDFTIPLVVPAVFPGPPIPPPTGTPVPDTLLIKSGTWSIKSNGGNTKLKTN